VLFAFTVGLLLRGFLALQLDLQGDEFLAVADGDFRLPGGLQVAVFQLAGLLQAGQRMALQARYGAGGQAQQLLQIAFLLQLLQQACGQREGPGLWTWADLAEHAQCAAGKPGSAWAREAPSHRAECRAGRWRRQLGDQAHQLCLEVGCHAAGEPAEQLGFQERAAVVQCLGELLWVAQLPGVRQAGQQALGAGAQFDTGVWRAGDLLQAAEQPRQ
jgi:hypothetical protein